MKLTKIHTHNKDVLLSDLYSHTISRLTHGQFDVNQTKSVLQMLNDLDWIEPAILRIPEPDRLKIYQIILKEMKEDDYPFHPLGWSTMYHFFNVVGLDTSAMAHVINTSQKLKHELQTSIIYSLIWN